MKVGVQWLLNHPEAALLLDPGLSKTAITLASLKLLMKVGAVKKALVVAPLRVCYLVWTHDGELGKWRDFRHFKEVVLHGPKKEKLLAQDADLYIVNFDGIEWLTSCRDCKHETHLGQCRHVRREVVRVKADGTPVLKEIRCECRTKSGAPIDRLKERGVDTLVIDELSKLKHTNTVRFKSLKPHLGHFKRRWGLTGSPAANGLLDLFGQAYVLDLGKSLGQHITHYRFAFFNPTGYGGYTWVPKEGARDFIFKAMKNLALSMKATDVLDLPDLVENNLWVELPEAARRIYDDLEQELIAQVEDNTVTAANAAVASGQCRQVASGGIYLHPEIAAEDLVAAAKGGREAMKKLKRPKETRHLHEVKTEAMMDLVDELQGSPLLVAYEFQHDLERIERALAKAKVDHAVIGGGTTPKQSKEIADRWNAGKLTVLVGHPAAMGHGLNLQAAGNHVCLYTTPWDYELYDQLIRRIWRQGNDNSRVFVHRILARRTVDEVVVRALGSKRRGQDALFDALKAHVDLTRRRQKVERFGRV